MSGGVFAIDRGIFDHRIFADEPYTEREAWLWLIGEAAWKPKRVRTPHGMVSLERGELAHSQRFMAAKWRWDRSRVRRFLGLLESEGMVTQQRPSNDPATTQQKAQETTHLTICNYCKYQFGEPRDEPSTITKNKRETNQNRPKEEEGRTNNNKRTYDEKFEEAWRAYPKRDGGNPKTTAAKRFLSAVKAGEDAQIIIDGIKRFAIAEQRNIGTPYIPQMVKWLGDRRWLDYDASSTIVAFDVRKHLV